MFRTSLIAGAALSALVVAACSKPADKSADAAASAPPAAAPAAPAAAAAAAAPAMTAADFVTKAASSDMFEITEAKLAQKKATSADIKTFAAKMITDHTKSTADLKAAIKSGQSLPLPPALPADLQAKVDALGKTSGADFDKTYVSQQVDAHTDTLNTMKGYAATGDVPALKDFATATTPVVQGHLDMIQKMQAAMK